MLVLVERGIKKNPSSQDPGYLKRVGNRDVTTKPPPITHGCGTQCTAGSGDDVTTGLSNRLPTEPPSYEHGFSSTPLQEGFESVPEQFPEPAWVLGCDPTGPAITHWFSCPEVCIHLIGCVD
jgi:hypothetical protein